MVINPLLHGMILQVIYSTQVVRDGVKTPINGRKWICNWGYFTLLIGVITPFTFGLWKTHLVRTSKKRDPPTMRKFVMLVLRYDLWGQTLIPESMRFLNWNFAKTDFLKSCHNTMEFCHFLCQHLWRFSTHLANGPWQKKFELSFPY